MKRLNAKVGSRVEVRTHIDSVLVFDWLPGTVTEIEYESNDPAVYYVELDDSPPGSKDPFASLVRVFDSEKDIRLQGSLV